MSPHKMFWCRSRNGIHVKVRGPEQMRCREPSRGGGHSWVEWNKHGFRSWEVCLKPSTQVRHMPKLIPAPLISVSKQRNKDLGRKGAWRRPECFTWDLTEMLVCIHDKHHRDFDFLYTGGFLSGGNSLTWQSPWSPRRLQLFGVLPSHLYPTWHFSWIYP